MSKSTLVQRATLVPSARCCLPAGHNAASYRGQRLTQQNSQEKRTGSLRRNVLWQFTVGPAFCTTGLLHERTQRYRSQRDRQKSLASVITAAIQTSQKQFATSISPESGSPNLKLPQLPVLLVNEQLDCSLEQLWSIIGQPDPQFQCDIHRLLGNRDVQQSSWAQKGGVLCREETYINPLKKNSLGPKEAFCLDQQRCTRRDSSGFVLERKIFTPKVPFGGSFHNEVLWCAAAQPGSQKVRLQVSCDIVFTGGFVPVRGIIYNAALEGMERFYRIWMHQLHVFIRRRQL